MFKNALNLRKMSVAELCKVAMLVAITLVLSYISGYLRIGNLSKFNISFMSVYIAGAAFGPFVSGTVAALADVISFVSNPTGPFMPVFTVLEFVNGFLFGLFLYYDKERKGMLFLLMTVLCVLLQWCVNIFIRTYFLANLYFGGQFVATFVSRIPSTTIMAVVKMVAIIITKPFMKLFISVLR